MGDVSSSSLTEQRQTITLNDDTFQGETLLRRNSSITRKTSLPTSLSIARKTLVTSNRKRMDHNHPNLGWMTNKRTHLKPDCTLVELGMRTR